MASNPIPNPTQQAEFEDVSISDSDGSKTSYDFAEDDDASDTEKVIALQTLPNYTPTSTYSLFQQAKNLLPSASSATPPSEEERLGKEKQNKKWILESQMTTGDSDIESVISEDSSPDSNVEAEDDFNDKKDTRRLHQQIATLEADVQAMDEMIKTVRNDASDYLVMIEEEHDEEARNYQNQVTTLKQERQKDFDAALGDSRNVFKSTEDRVKNINKAHELQLHRLNIQHFAELAEKTKEITKCRETVELYQRNHTKQLADLYTSYNNHLDQKTNYFQAIIAGMSEAQRGYIAEFQKLELTQASLTEDALEGRRLLVELKGRADAYENLFNLSSAHLKSVSIENKKLKGELSELKSKIATEKEAQTEAASLLLQSRMNYRYAHEQDIRKADSVIEQVKSLKERLEIAEAKNVQYEQIIDNTKKAMIETNEELDVSEQAMAELMQEFVLFTDQIIELPEERNIVEEVINTYADQVIAGEMPDLQEEWDKLIDEMERIICQPIEVLVDLFERIGKLTNFGQEAAENEHATNKQGTTDSVMELQKSLESVLGDAKANEERNEALEECEECEDLRNHIDDLEFFLEDEAQEMFEEMSQQIQETVKGLTEVVDLMKMTIEMAEAKEKRLSDVESLQIDRFELKIAEQDIKDLQMAVHRAEQRGCVAEAELRSVGQDIEGYLKQIKARDTGIEIDKLTGRGAGKAMETVFWLLETDQKQLALNIDHRLQAQRKLGELEREVEDSAAFRFARRGG